MGTEVTGTESLPNEPQTQVEPSPAPEQIDVDARSANLRAAFTAQPRKMAEAAEEEPEPAKVPEEPKPSFAQITQEQFDALTAKAADIDALKAEQAKGFGTIGSTIQGFGRKIAELSNPIAAPIFDFSDEEIASIKDDFPALAAGLTKLKTARPAEIDQDALLAKVREQLVPDLQKVEAEAETKAWRRVSTKMLTDMHPDWREVTGSAEGSDGTAFKAFTDAQPKEFQTALAKAAEEWDFSAIGRAVSAFKEAQKKAAATASTRQARLDQGVNPRGAAPLGQPTLTQTNNLRDTFKKYAHGSG